MSFLKGLTEGIIKMAGATGGPGPMGALSGGALASIMQRATGDIGKLTQKMLGNLTKDLNIFTSLFGGLGAAGSLPGGFGARPAAAPLPDMRAVQCAFDRIAFVGVLQRALEKASDQQHFNLETAINDLWVSVSNLRNGTTSLQTSQARISAPGAAPTMSPDEIKKMMEKLKSLL